MNNETSVLSIKQNMIWNTVGCLIYQGCLWAITVLVVTLSGYTNSGYLAFAMAIGNIFFPIASFNVRTFQVSDVKNEFSQGNYIAFRIITIVLALIIMIAYLLFSASSIQLVLVTLSWLVFKTDESFCYVFYGTDQKFGRMDFIGISQGLRGIGLILSFSIILYFTQNIILAIIFMSFFCISVTFIYDFRKTRTLSSLCVTITKERIISLFRQCFPSMLTLLCFAAAPSIVRQIYESCEGAEMLGIYAAIATPTVLIQAAASYLYGPFIEPLAKALYEGKQSFIRSTISKICFAIVGACIICLLIAYLWGTDLLVLVFGKAIEEYSYILPCTVLAATSIAAMGFFIEIMIVYRHLIVALISNLVALLISLITINFLINQFSMNGINLAIVLSFIVSIFIGLFLFSILELKKKHADST